MSGPLVIDPGERGRVRLFAVDLSEPDLRVLSAAGQDAQTGDPDVKRPFAPAVAHLLGDIPVDTGPAELFDLRDLAGLGLAGYLAQGYDIAETQLASHRDAFAALEGFVLVLPSEATPDGGSLNPRPELRLLGVFETPKAAISMKRLTSDTARGFAGPSGDDTAPPRGAFPARALAFAALIILAIAAWLWLTLG